MNRKRLTSVPHFGLYGLAVLLSLLALLFITFLVSSKTVHALPEYTVRTGQSCASCHVNPGGGGPRTLLGLLWGARGRPDEVPTLPGMLIAPRVSDAVELYEIGCGGCHGMKAEGLSALGLANTNISEGSMRSFTLYGIKELGMPGFEGQYSDEQFEALIGYVTALASGEASPPVKTFDLPRALFNCVDVTDTSLCSSTYSETGGN